MRDPKTVPLPGDVVRFDGPAVPESLKGAWVNVWCVYYRSRFIGTVEVQALDDSTVTMSLAVYRGSVVEVMEL